VETTGPEAVFDRFGAEPERKQLTSRDDAMLPTHQLPHLFGPRL